MLLVQIFVEFLPLKGSDNIKVKSAKSANVLDVGYEKKREIKDDF